MNYQALIAALLIVTVGTFCWVEYGKPILTMLGIQSDERDQ